MYITQNIQDEKLIREEYFNLKNDERNELRAVFSNLSKYNKNFESIIVSIEKDIETRYKSEAQPKF
jgi:hypothetical protein